MIPSPVLIIGETGQLARALARSFTARKIPFKTLGRYHVDLSKCPENIAPLITGSGAKAVINCAAFTDVDGAETERDAANFLNHLAPGFMAETCAAHDLPFIHISTDYVFKGQGKRPYTTRSRTDPLNWYGRTKCEGERRVLQAGGASLILRTSWLFDGTGRNFLTTMLRLGQDRQSLKIVNDQIGRPTYAGHLAEACVKALSNMPASPALHHVTNTGPEISWAGFAKAIFELANIDCKIIEIPTSEYPTPAKRPAYSVLDTRGFETFFKHPLEPWQTGLALAMAERH